MLPAILRHPASPRFKLTIVVTLVLLSSVATWRLTRTDLDIATAAARRPLVVVNGKVTQMPSGDYLAANTLVDTTACSSSNVIKWDGTQFACGSAGGGGSGTVSSVGSGSGISGGPITTSGNLAIDPTYTQRRVSGTCTTPNSIGAINQDGTVSCITGSSLGSGSITIAAGSATSPVALPTLGTTDWIDSLATLAHAGRAINCDPSASVTACWEKVSGASLLTNFDWFGIAAGSPNGGVSGLWTFTAGSADSMTGTSLSSANVATTNTSTTGVGIRWILPSIGGNVQRVARLYLYQYDSAVTCTATALDGTAAGSSATVNSGSGGVVVENVWTITYKTNYAAPVTFLCTMTANTGAGTPAFGWAAASLGPT